MEKNKDLIEATEKAEVKKPRAKKSTASAAAEKKPRKTKEKDEEFEFGKDINVDDFLKDAAPKPKTDVLADEKPVNIQDLIEKAKNKALFPTARSCRRSATATMISTR